MYNYKIQYLLMIITLKSTGTEGNFLHITKHVDKIFTCYLLVIY